MEMGRRGEEEKHSGLIMKIIRKFLTVLEFESNIVNLQHD